jgi:hypothetical protein
LATPDIVTTRIGSRSKEGAECCRGELVLISKRLWATEDGFWNEYHSYFSLIIPEEQFSAIFIHSSVVFHYTIDSGAQNQLSLSKICIS